MSALIAERFVAVTPTLVRCFGAVGAIVLQEIHFVELLDGKGGDANECAEAQAVIARDTGLSLDQVQKAVAKLVADGVVVAKPDPKDKRRRVYTVNREMVPPAGHHPDRSPQNGGDREPPQIGGEVSADRRRSAGGTSIRRTREEQPPLTPPEEGRQGSLLDASNEETPVRERRKRAAANPMLDATFDEWWARYPSGKKGDRRAALRAFSKAIAIDSMATIDAQLANYVAARALYAAQFPGHSAPLRHASTWLNQARYTCSEPWTLEDVKYWPAPPGRSWDSPSPRGEAREELMARELAREQREAEERAAAMVDFEDDDDEEWV